MTPTFPETPEYLVLQPHGTSPSKDPAQFGDFCTQGSGGIHEEMEGRIILVRHGETEANRRRCFAQSDDIPLTEVGRRQAADVAARLAREFRPDLLLSSPFPRARETSEIVSRVVGLDVEVLPDIQERDFGRLRGLPYARMGQMMLADANYDCTRPWLWSPPEGESLDGVRRRAFHALDELRKRAAHEIVVVCHGAVIQAVCAQITGEWRETWVPPNCGFAVVEYSASGWQPPAISGDWEDLSLK